MPKKPFPKFILPWSTVCIGLVIGWQALAKLMYLGPFGTSVGSLYAFLATIALFVLVARVRVMLLPLACVLFPVAFGVSYTQLHALASWQLVFHGYFVLGLAVIALASLVITEGKLTLTTLGLFTAGLCVSGATILLVTLNAPTVEVVLGGALIIIGALLALVMRVGEPSALSG